MNLGVGVGHSSTTVLSTSPLLSSRSAKSKMKTRLLGSSKVGILGLNRGKYVPGYFYSVISIEMGPTLNVRHERQIVSSGPIFILQMIAK